MKDRVYIEVPKEHRQEIRELHGEPLIIDVNRVLVEKPIKKTDEPITDRQVKTFAKGLHTQLEKGKKSRK